MRKVNRDKSLAKIAELTKQHQLDKLSKEQKQKRLEEDLSESEGEKEEEKETKTQGKSLHKSKLENKRKQKEAIKNNKMKRQKGIPSQPKPPVRQ